MKAFRYFLLATTIVIFLLVVLGNVVRVSDAAQACPDWPTCFGQFAWPVETLGAFTGAAPCAGGPGSPAGDNLGSLGDPAAGGTDHFNYLMGRGRFDGH